MPKKIVIVTTGQPSTNPRMVKEYQALKEEGYIVKVFYSFWADWAVSTDHSLFETGQISKNDFILIGGSPSSQKRKYYYSRLINKIFRIFKSQSNYALSRTVSHLEKAALREKADCYIAHNLGAISAAVKAAKKYKGKAAFDAEDFHRGEYKDQNSVIAKSVRYTEDKYLPQCSYITAASPLICQAYQRLYPSQRIAIINNVFSKKYLQKRNKEVNNNLKLFWFSQTIGPNRGLEKVVKAIEIIKDKCNVELFLMGKISSEYNSDLLNLTTVPNSIHFIHPVPPIEVFAEAAKYDVGLSLEVPETENRDICLTNKLFTYLLAGNCIILSNTKAQKEFINCYPGIGYVVNTNSEVELADILLNLFSNRDQLITSQLNSLRVASERLNWENESEKFKQVIKEQLK